MHMHRQVVLDTETTGIEPNQHRIIEIGCVELINRQHTGRCFHEYINPMRAVDEGAFKVHGISDAFLADKPLFKDIYPKLLEFIAGAELVIHNAPFDVGFLNAEFARISGTKSVADICSVLDTLDMAREKHPGQRNSLDALCKRYDIDNSKRELHGALLDAQILAEVYLAMTGGQSSLFSEEHETQILVQGELSSHSQLQSCGLVIRANAEEQAQHKAYVELLIKKSGKNWFE